jgi:hypothetical protein
MAPAIVGASILYRAVNQNDAWSFNSMEREPLPDSGPR